MRPLTCQPCTLCKERSECLTKTKTFWEQENNEALLEGRAGPEFERGSDASRKEERRPARRERVPVDVASGIGPPWRRAQQTRWYGGHARRA